MAYSGNTGITRIVKAAGYSWKGLVSAFSNEAAFRQELALAVLLVPLAIWLAMDFIQLALMIFSVLLVLIVEVLNSAIEAVVDRFGGELHELSGRAKDMGSAAVMLSLLNLCVVWGLVLWQNLG